ncbi:hypothetical protein [Dethiothermospora halolimnae]|uniref:hypothetical protein n=1 Tax=Dethiothermospora halolimnae TaxID=3114390 RepID=UPI003CCBDDBA
MKNISNYKAQKYDNKDRYTFIEEGIYLFKNMYDSIENGMYVYGNMMTSRVEPDYYVTSLSFEQEPEFNEGTSPKLISQYPLEDILDEFLVHVSDFYEEINDKSDTLCYQEFASPDIEDIKKIREIIGKHVYNNEFVADDGQTYIKLMIE